MVNNESNELDTFLVKHTDSWGRIIAVTIGCVLLFLGNVLPWPCVAGWDARDCTVLVTYRLSESMIGIVLVAGLLLIPLAVNLLKSPLNYVYWLSFWLLIFLLFVMRLAPDHLGGRTALPLVYVNQILVGPSLLVMPVSLIVFWLAARPLTLQKGWRLLAVASLVTLIFLTGYFYILSGIRFFQFTLLPNPFEGKGIFGVGPLLIILGGVVLLGAEYIAMHQDKKKAMPKEVEEEESIPIAPRKMRNVGYWSAISVTVLSILPIILALVGSRIERFDNDAYLLFDYLNLGASFLMPLALVVLMACINYYAPPGKRIWTRIALLLVILYAILRLSFACFFSVLSHGNLPPDHWLVTNYQIFSRDGGLSSLSFALVSLAGLLLLPVFRGAGIEAAIRWCLFAMAVFMAGGILSSLLGNDRMRVLPALLISVPQWIILPVTTALIAVVFKRAE